MSHAFRRLRFYLSPSTAKPRFFLSSTWDHLRPSTATATSPASSLSRRGIAPRHHRARVCRPCRRHSHSRLDRPSLPKLFLSCRFYLHTHSPQTAPSLKHLPLPHSVIVPSRACLPSWTHPQSLLSFSVASAFSSLTQQTRSSFSASTSSVVRRRLSSLLSSHCHLRSLSPSRASTNSPSLLILFLLLLLLLLLLNIPTRHRRSYCLINLAVTSAAAAADSTDAVLAGRRAAVATVDAAAAVTAVTAVSALSTSAADTTPVSVAGDSPP